MRLPLGTPQHLARRAHAFDELVVPEGFDFGAINGLSNEVRERLTKARPTTFAAVRSQRGVTPAAATLVLIHLRRAAHVSRETSPVENGVDNGQRKPSPDVPRA